MVVNSLSWRYNAIKYFGYWLKTHDDRIEQNLNFRFLPKNMRGPKLSFLYLPSYQPTDHQSESCEPRIDNDVSLKNLKLSSVQEINLDQEPSTYHLNPADTSLDGKQSIIIVFETLNLKRIGPK